MTLPIIAGMLVALSLPWLIREAPQQPASGETPQIAVAARALNLDGSSGGWAGGTDPLVVGKTTTSYLHAGRTGEDQLCSLGSSDGTVRGFDALIQSAAHVWRVSTTGVSYEAGKMTIDLDWSRYAGGSGASPVASGRQRLVLLQGQSYPIDLVRGPTDRCRTVSVILEVSADATERPDLADTVLEYDLWLVRRDATGRRQAQHVILAGTQGMAVPFAFTPIRFGVIRLQSNQYDFKVATRVEGTLRGRARPDGRISLELASRRMDRLERPGEEPSNVVPGQGRKILELGEDETIEIELPARSGYTARFASDADAASRKGESVGMRAGPGVATEPVDPVLIRDGRLVVNFKPFFANETLSLLIRVRRLDASEVQAAIR